MSTPRFIIVFILFTIAITVLWTARLPVLAAPENEPVEQEVEYKVVAADQLGIINAPRAKGFNRSEAEKKLNQLAAEGWRWKEFVPVGSQSAVIFVRRK